MNEAQHRTVERRVGDYQAGYDDAKSEPCSKCKELRKIVIDHCEELIEFLEDIDGVVVEVGTSTKILNTGDKIEALKELRKHAEYGG